MRNVDPHGAQLHSRRRFLQYLVGGIVGAIAVAVAVPVVRYFIDPALKEAETKWVPVGRKSDVPVGKPTFLIYEERVKDSWSLTTRRSGVWVVTKDGESFTVFDAHCTHLGCLYSWKEDKNQFLCPCHTGIFDIDGKVLSGPPPRSLDRLQNKVEDGVILIGGPLKGGETAA